MAGANEFVIPRGRTAAPLVLGLQPGWPAPDSCQSDAGLHPRMVRQGE